MFSVCKRLGSTRAEVFVVIQKTAEARSILQNDRRSIGKCFSVSAWESLSPSVPLFGFLSDRMLDTVDQVKIPRTAAAGIPMNVLSRAD